MFEQGAIDENNHRINKDKLGVYCTGDLIDGGVNRLGDLLLLDYAREWFDEIVIGNHEYPFMGGPGFLGLRQHDRELQRKLLQLEYEGKYVPSTVVDGYLLVHAGFAKRWAFENAEDTNDVIHMLWRDAQEDKQDVPMLDWIGPYRGGKWANDTGGIFWLDWAEARNRNFNQVMGHSTLTDGPRVVRYVEQGTEHWNIDAGGKYGIGLGGIITEQGQPTKPVFWGRRVILQNDWEEEDANPSQEAIDELDADMWNDIMRTT